MSSQGSLGFVSTSAHTWGRGAHRNPSCFGVLCFSGWGPRAALHALTWTVGIGWMIRRKWKIALHWLEKKT